MKNGDKPAYAAVCDNSNPYLQEGLTKREYFAAMAMQGMLANSVENQEGLDTFFNMKYPELAKCAVRQADALLNALESKDN